MGQSKLRQDWIDKARRDGEADAENAKLVKDKDFLAKRRVYLMDNRWSRMGIDVEDAMILQAAWCEGAGLK